MSSLDVPPISAGETTVTHSLFSLTTVASMAVFFLLVAWACARLLSHWRPTLGNNAPSATAWIDGLRGLAATLVLLNHIPLVVANHLQLAPTITFEATQLVNYLGAVGVQLFFCITGFLFASKILGSSNVDWTDFFVRRIRRLVPAYALAVLLALVVGAVAVDANFEYVGSALRALPHIMSFGIFVLPEVQGFDMSRLLGVNWTLAIEWRFYAVLPLLFALRRFGHMNGPISLLVFAVVLVPVLGAGIWLYFIVGAAATLMPKVALAHAWRGPLIVLAIGSVLSMAWNWDALATEKVAQGLHIASLFFSLCLLKPRLLTTNALTALGAISYSLYLLHIMVMFVLFGLVHEFLFDVTSLPAAGFALMGALGVALSVLVAALAYEHIELRFMSTKKSLLVSSPDVFSPVFSSERLRRENLETDSQKLHVRPDRRLRLVGSSRKKCAAALPASKQAEKDTSDAV